MWFTYFACARTAHCSTLYFLLLVASFAMLSLLTSPLSLIFTAYFITNRYGVCIKYWLYKKLPANRSDCTLSLRWEQGLLQRCRRGRRCSELWKKNSIFPEHPEHWITRQSLRCTAFWYFIYSLSATHPIHSSPTYCYNSSVQSLLLLAAFFS